ncbi:POU domain protein [Aphelenchoides besseyi]|nr:POU domain protein [Aphelenchoides besseyi]
MQIELLESFFILLNLIYANGRMAEMGSDAEFWDDWFEVDYPNDNSSSNYAPTIEDQNEIGISAATNLMNADNMDFVVPLQGYRPDGQQSSIPPYDHSDPNDQTCQYFWPSAMPLRETQYLQTDVANSFLVAATNRVNPYNPPINPRHYGHNVDGNFYSSPYYSFEYQQPLVMPIHPFNNSQIVSSINIPYDESATSIAPNEPAKQSEIEQTSELASGWECRGCPRGCKNVNKIAMISKQNTKDRALKRKKKPEGSGKAFKESNEQTELFEANERFRLRRIELNVSQCDLCISLIPLFGVHLSQATISRYENSRLSIENLKKLRHVMDAWMQKADEALAKGKTIEKFVKESTELVPNQSVCLEMEESLEPLSEVEETSDSLPFAFMKRCKRTCLTKEQINSMVAEFDYHPKPSNERISELARGLGLLPSKKKQRDDEHDIIEQSLY